MPNWTINTCDLDNRLLPVLHEYGFAIIPAAISVAARRRLNDELDGHFSSADPCEGLFYGLKTKRFGRLLSRSRECQNLALNSIAMKAALGILGDGCEQIQLNLTQAIEIGPGSPSQVPHRDQDIWMGARHSGEMMLNCMWAIDDFTAENGATMIWPGSHLEPDEALPDGEPIQAEMAAGSVCILLGSTLHGGGSNWTEQRRRGLVMSYCLGWLKPCENPWLAYPPHVAKEFNAELSNLIGYRMDAPSLNNFEGRCPSELLIGESGSVEGAFVDRLTADQKEMIRQFNAEQFAQRKVAA